MDRVRQEVAAISALEHEIIEKFQQLQPDEKERVQQILADTLPQPTFDYSACWAEVEALQTDIRARLGETATVGTLSLLEELCEEASC